MNVTLAAADIARRIPEMAMDSPINNEGLIQRILESHSNPKTVVINHLADWLVWAESQGVQNVIEITHGPYQTKELGA